MMVKVMKEGGRIEGGDDVVRKTLGTLETGLGVGSFARATLLCLAQLSKCLLAHLSRSKMSVAAQSGDGSEISIPIAQYSSVINGWLGGSSVSKASAAE